MEWFNFRIINGRLKFCPILYDIAGVSRKFSWNIPNSNFPIRPFKRVLLATANLS